MKTKRIEQFVKEYFYFSQTERRGIIALIIMVVFAFTIPFLYNFIFPPAPLDISIETLQAQPVSNPNFEEDRSTSLFSFDPNKATENELKALGFPDKSIVTLKRYVAKGGKFKKPEDLNKIYGLRPELVEKLLPYIVIGEPVKNSQTVFVSDTISTKKKYSNRPVELNTADTTALIALYRIGPGMARRIVEYRDKLGGFLSLDQLTEIYGFDEDILYDLKGKIYVDASKAHIFELNTVSVDELRNHPYFKYKLSNAIVNYRNQHGAYTQLSDLKKIVLVNDSIYQNIILYLKIK